MSAQSSLDALLAGEAVAERSFGSRVLSAMNPLIMGGVIRRFGRRTRLQAANMEALRKWVETTYPHGLEPTKPATRADAVLLHSDSKRGRTSGSPTVLLRSLGEAVLTNVDGTRIHVRDRAAKVGALGLDLTHNRPVTTSPIALIENSEPFYDDALLRRLGLADHIVIYTHGNPSRSLLEWIATSGAPAIMHLPDYDSTGLSCFLRLHAATGGLAKLYVPNDFERMVRSYGNHDLALNLSKSTDRALTSTSHPLVREVVQVLLKTGAGLEQEALSLP